MPPCTAGPGGKGRRFVSARCRGRLRAQQPGRRCRLAAAVLPTHRSDVTAGHAPAAAAAGEAAVGGGEGPETMRLLAKWKDPHVSMILLVHFALCTLAELRTAPIAQREPRALTSLLLWLCSLHAPTSGGHADLAVQVLVAVLGAMVTNGDETVQPFSISSRGRGRGMPAASSKADNRWLCIGLAGCVPVLALLKDLLSAPYPL